MSSNVKDVLDAPIIRLDSVDSTNNYAAQYIDADTAVDGLTIVSRSQTAGKGQRGNVWRDQPDSSLLMSMIIYPQITLDQQFMFSAKVAVALAEEMIHRFPHIQVRIKFPNDLILNDKKAAGILIENSIRGNSWTHAVIGIGINLLQTEFPASLPHATSLFLATGEKLATELLLIPLRERLIRSLKSGTDQLDTYNELLYGRGCIRQFRKEDQLISGELLCADKYGKLHLRLVDGTYINFYHGEYEWVW